MKLVVATRNPHKLSEICQILAGTGYEILSLEDFPSIPEIEEDGESFAENAQKKARTIAKWTHHLCLADDSGLVVDALDGAPGVHSKRFGGPTDADRNARLLKHLQGVPREERTARFVCVVALVWPTGEEHLITGICEGWIGYHPRGSTGFGYDPLFVVPEYDRTFAELGPEIKNQISHRARAFQQVRDHLLRDHLA